MKHHKADHDNQDIKAQILDTAGLVEYQDGAVVSRTIIKKDTGTITLFAFDAGQGLSEHTTPFDAMIQVLEGELEVIISGKAFHLNAGHMIIMPAHEPHALKAKTKIKMQLTMIRS